MSKNVKRKSMCDVFPIKMPFVVPAKTGIIKLRPDRLLMSALGWVAGSRSMSRSFLVAEFENGKLVVHEIAERRGKACALVYEGMAGDIVTTRTGRVDFGHLGKYDPIDAVVDGEYFVEERKLVLEVPLLRQQGVRHLSRREEEEKISRPASGSQRGRRGDEYFKMELQRLAFDLLMHDMKATARENMFRDSSESSPVNPIIRKQAARRGVFGDGSSFHFSSEAKAMIKFFAANGMPELVDRITGAFAQLEMDMIKALEG